MAWSRWIGDDSGQDLIEYALLTSFLGIAGLLGMQAPAKFGGLEFGQLRADLGDLRRLSTIARP